MHGNHRNIPVADGRIGFACGWNIREGYWLAKRPSHPVRDRHFRIEDPVLARGIADGPDLGAWQRYR